MIFDNSEFFDRSVLEKHQRVESVSPDLKLLDIEPLGNQLPLLSSATGLPTPPTITLPPQPTPPTGLAGTNLTQGADSSGFSEGADIIYGLGGNDGLVMRGGDDIVFGGDGDDIIYGQDGDDQLYGEGGIDRLFGGDGDDILDGGADADVLVGGAGNDTMTLGDGNDTAYGQDGDDIIYGGDGSDTIFGGAGNDQADGGAGVDVLIMGDGNDTVLAGAGDDVIYGEAGDDAIDGGSGNDTIFGGSGNNTLIGGAGIDVLITEDGNDAIYGGADNDVIYAFGGDDFVDGGDGSDTIFGGAGNDTLRGGAGDDVIADVSGNDTLDGGDGNDVVNGLAGNDRITGGNGDNIVLGGTGADVFYQAGTGIDRILDFQLGIDKIELSASVTDFNALIASAQDNVDANGNSQVIISNGEGGFFVLSNITAADLSVSDFIYRNEAPVFTSSATASVAENQNSAFTASATDAEGVTLTYSLSGADAALFNIDAATGVVTFKTAPDFEAPGDVDGNNAYDVIVTASDGINSTNQSVAITVTNVNDIAPVFTSAASAVLTEGQTAAFTAQATDVEGDTLTYALSGVDAALFNIDAATGAVTFKAAPDFEVPADDGGNNIYDVIVTASDGINTADQSVVISVVGGNDNAPVFSSGATASVAENQTSAYTASATDADGNQIYYSLSGADFALFNIDANGVVTFKVAPDFEAPGDADGDNVYDIVVTADDGAAQTNQTVAITVTDVEENVNAPIFTSGASASFAENGTGAAYTAITTDVDGEARTYSLSGTDAALFNIDVNSGVVTFKEAPDFETPGDTGGNNVYDIVVTANDGVNQTDQAVAITVTDLNDEAPAFTSGTTASVLENQTAAYTAITTDADGGARTYSLSGTDAALFNIDVNSGVVTFKTAPDFETPSDAGGNNVYDIVVTANDGANQTDQSVSISVINENDSAPTFLSGATVAVTENQTSAYTSSVTDADGNQISFSLSGVDATLFNIDVNSGVVTFKVAPDFEVPGDSGNDNVYDIVVTADDGVAQTNQAVAITVTNVVEPARVTDLTTLNAVQGFIIQGDGSLDFSGASVSSAGDVNGDGFDDLIVGATGGDDGGENAGEAYVVFGGAGGFGTTDGSGRQVIDLTNLTSSQGFVIQGDSTFDQAGSSVSSAGDVNGDGFDDLIVGAPTGDYLIAGASTGNGGGNRAGEAYVVFGGAGGFGTADGSGRQVIDLTGLTESQGFIIQGDSANDRTGFSVSSAGDVNGDGFDDLIVSAPFGGDGGDFAGEAYVVFGGAGGFGTADGSGREVIDLTSLTASQGFIIQGDLTFDRAGNSVSSAGDLNGDGFDDLIVGVREGSDGGFFAGEAYVVFGGAGGFGTADGSGRQVIDLTSLTVSQGFIIQGDVNLDNAGASVSSAGDVNGDGFDDLVVGAPGGDDGGENAGEAYVVFGGAGGFGAADGSGRQVIDLTSLTVLQGFIIQGDTIGDRTGFSVSSAGDVNGDGFDDLIIGARWGDDGGDFAGEAYVVFGGAGGFGTADGSGRQVIDLTGLTESQGFIIQGDSADDWAGHSVFSAGDVNSDGFDDLIVGAPYSDDGGLRAGISYVIFGGTTGTESTVVVTSAGTGAADNFTGNAGNDTFAGIATGDVVRGGAGNDRITVTNLDFADIRGGTGVDTLVLDGAGLNLDATGPGNASLGSIEVFDITGSGNNTLTLDALAVFDLTEERSGGRATLDVIGNAGDTVDLTGSNFTAGVQVVEGGITYNSFSDGNATVRVQDGVTVTLMPPPVAEKVDDDTVIAERPADALWFQDGPIHIASADLFQVMDRELVQDEAWDSLLETRADNLLDALGADFVVDGSLLSGDQQSWGDVFASLSVGRDGDLSQASSREDDMFNDLSLIQADQSLYDLNEFQSLSADYVSPWHQTDPTNMVDPMNSDFGDALDGPTFIVDDGAFI
ncbi:hypothetical protein GCM10007853_17860 [Algimonas ampicilliniresistens]|uniref:Cadherin domain-containing protein n=1 Tax=Algimonas ampicilliniresistens TaxID=1298735 RepID=A0ABQ5VA80_9PROT|nr:hypothetical protein [Algimonas ampicilliniresistens]GLQ23912.1 hypothetical protein GCM10007853_17860 [Algimonas ampicilliniresistens]